MESLNRVASNKILSRRGFAKVCRCRLQPSRSAIAVTNPDDEDCCGVVRRRQTSPEASYNLWGLVLRLMIVRSALQPDLNSNQPGQCSSLASPGVPTHTAGESANSMRLCLHSYDSASPVDWLCNYICCALPVPVEISS